MTTRSAPSKPPQKMNLPAVERARAKNAYALHNGTLSAERGKNRI
jgi:hypothetical protein